MHQFEVMQCQIRNFTCDVDINNSIERVLYLLNDYFKLKLALHVQDRDRSFPEHKAELRL